MPAGTIALTNNAATVTGNGTAFLAELKPNDFIVIVVGQVTYTLGIKSVNSNTSVTLVRNYAGPAAAGLAWTAVPNQTMVGITAQVASDTARAIRGLNLDKANWQQVYSGNGQITVTLPDGSEFTGPAWNSIVTSLNGKAGLVDGAVPVSQGGTGAVNAESARSNLGLGSSATKDIGASAGNVLGVGTLGFGGTLPTSPYHTTVTNMHFTPANSGASQPTSDSGWCHLVMAASSFYRAQLSIKYSEGKPRAFILNRQGTGSGGWTELYSTANTTRTSDGTLKAASPVVRIFSDGSFENNDESEGATVTREGEGVYRIDGVWGMNADAAWGGIDGGFDVPQDRNKQPLIWLDYEVDADGSVVVKTFHRTHPDSPLFAQNNIDGYEDGQHIDIPADQFVSVRVQMPDNSIWNMKQRELMDSVDEQSS